MNNFPVTTPITANGVNIPTFDELLARYRNPGDNTDTINPLSDTSSQPFIGPVLPKDITSNTPYPTRNNPVDAVQNNTTVTPGRGSSNVDFNSAADAINAAQGIQTSYAVPSSRGVLSQMIADRAMGRGLYAVEPGLQLSPEQIAVRRNAADNFYANQIAEMEQKESKSNTGVDNSLISGNTKATPYLQALFTNPDVAKSPTYLKQLSANLKGQTPDQQIETVKRVVMQNLPIAQQNQFNSNDQVAGQISGAFAYLPTDISNNPYKYQTQRFVTYLGGSKDPKYNDFKSIIGNITAPYLNQLYGAVLSSGELARANQFVPDLETDDTATIFQKLKNLQSTTRFANDKLLARYTGAPEPNFQDYLSGKIDKENSSQPQSPTTGPSGINPLWNSF